MIDRHVDLDLARSTLHVLQKCLDRSNVRLYRSTCVALSTSRSLDLDLLSYLCDSLPYIPVHNNANIL